jgi:ferritin-like metal-binding protein YciE
VSLNTLQDLFVEQLQDLYSAEMQFAEAQPKLAEAASSEELKTGILQHVEETKAQIARLEQVAERCGVSSLKGKTCQAAKGLVKEAQELLEEEGDAKVLDAGMIAALQRVEHYEMAGYGTVVAYAKQLGHDEALELLQKTLEEEKATDQKLSKLAETAINQQAA